MTKKATNISFLASGILVALLILSAAPQALAATKPIIWKPIERAILKVTGRKPPKTWSVLQDTKKSSRVLVELDNRYVVLDAKTKEAFEMSPSEIRAHGKDFESIAPSGANRALPSTDWDMRDIGPAERIQVRLTTDNTLLDVELPHPLNLRVP